MRFDEFLGQITIVEECFTRKYNKPQRDLLWKESKDLNAHHFSILCDRLMIDMRYLPKPKDFKDAIKRLKFSLKKLNASPDEKQPVDCELCVDLGYRFARDKVSGYEPILLMCSCGGHPLHFEKDFAKVGDKFSDEVELITFDMSQLVPSDKTYGSKSFNKLVENWKVMKQMSRDFWVDRRKNRYGQKSLGV